MNGRDTADGDHTQRLLDQQLAAMKASVDGMAILDGHQRYVYMNESHARIYGYTDPEELVGEKWDLLYDEGQRHWFERYTLPVLVEKGYWRGEATGTRRDGSTFPQELSITAIEGGGFVCIVRDITAHKRIEEGLRESEERFKILFEQAVDFLVVHDASGKVVDANSQTCRALGYSREEMLSMHVEDYEMNLLPAEEREKQERQGGTLWQRIVANEPGAITELQRGEHRRKDGTAFPVEVRVGGVLHHGERMILASSRDVTEQKRAQEALRESEQRYRSLFDQNPDAVYSLDLEGNYLAANAACEKVSGYTVEELLQRSFVPLVVPEDLERTWQGFERAASGEPQNYEIAITHKDGLRVELNVTNVPIVVDDEIVGVYGIAKDITERKQAEEALAKSEERFRSLVRNAPDVITLLDTDSTILYDSPAIERVLGYRPEERVGTRGFDYVHPADRERARRTFGEALENPGVGITVEYRLQHRDGSWRYFEAIRTNLLDDPAVGAIILNYRNITERKRVEDALRQSEKRFRTIFENTALGISIADPDRRLLETNSAYHRITGYSGEELFGRPIAEISHPDDVSTDEERREEVHAGRLDRYQREKRYFRKDGEEIWVQPTISVVRDREGEPQFFVGTVEDITERREAEEKLKESEERFRGAFENASSGAALVGLNRRYLKVNSSLCEMLGYSEEELLAKRTQDITHHEDLEKSQARSKHLFEGEGTSSLEKRYIHKDGHTVWAISDVSLVRNFGGAPSHFVSQFHDITARKRAEVDLRESEELLKTVTGGAPVILFSLDREGTITLSEGKALESVGEKPGEAVGKSVFEVYTNLPDVLDNVRRALGGEEVTALVEIGGLTFEARYSPIWEESGEVSGVVGVATDVTERQVLEKELEYRAFHDSLTGLPNRALFSDRLEHALSRRSRQRESVAVLVLDLDNFKLINDSLGHSAGDGLLTEFAERLWSCVRPGDTVARLGGDEFAILVEDIEDRDVATRVAERIEEKIKRPFSLEEADHEVWATTSIGIAFAGDSGETMGDLLRRADVAMYRVKGRGKADHEIFDSVIDTRFVGRSGPAYELRRAIEREELTVRYQPVASLETGEIVYLEALVRWEHPERGLLLPQEFVPLAEETGLIVLLDQWVLWEACRQERRWREERPEVAPPTVSVNLSTKQLARPRLVEEVTSVLEETSLEPSSLQLEITESATIEDTSAAENVLDRLKALGVRFAVDDFGTGYSSISYLTQFPMDSVKIDRSVVAVLGREPRGEAVISAVIALAHSLGETVVAEGVEDAEQLEHLRDLGCEFGQGEHFWPALPAAEALEFYLESLRRKPAWASR